jgi:hypothetical protein
MIIAVPTGIKIFSWLLFSFSKRGLSHVIINNHKTHNFVYPTKIITSRSTLANRYFHSESGNKDSNSFIPAKFYENADISKHDVIKDNTNKLGVYRWVNLLTGKSYIGSSVNLIKEIL